MEKEDLMKYLEHDFYSIEEINGNKYVHIWGYCYWCDDIDYCGKDYRHVELTFCLIPVSDFPMTDEELLNREGCVKWYMSDLDEDECMETIAEYCNGVTELPYDKITPDTPVGDYVNY